MIYMEPKYENILCPYDCIHDHEHTVERNGFNGANAASSGGYNGASSNGTNYARGARGVPGTGRGYAYNGARQDEQYEIESGQGYRNQGNREQRQERQQSESGMPTNIFVEAYNIPPKQKSMSEQSTGSPIINMVPDGGRSGNGDAFGGMGAMATMFPMLAMLGLLGGRGFGNGFGGGDGFGGGRALEAVIAEQIGDVRHDIGAEAIASLKESFAADKDAIRAGFAAELAGVKAGLESKLETERAINKIDEHITESTEHTGNKLFAIEKSMDDKFCGLKEEMLKGFASVKEREILDELRVERNRNAQLHETIRDRALLTDFLTAIGVPTPVTPLAKSV